MNHPATDAVLGIGQLNESPLHRALKELYARPGDAFEVPIEGFIADIARGRDLIEVQTGSFGAMANKLDRLLDHYRLLLVYPVAETTFLVRPNGQRRRSPRRGTPHDLFRELASIPTLLDHPHFALEVVMLTVERHQTHDPRARRGRGGYRTIERRLDEVHSQIRFDTPADLLRLVPDGLPEVFGTKELAEGAGIPRTVAQAMAYCCVRLGLFVAQGRTRAGVQYRLAH